MVDEQGGHPDTPLAARMREAIGLDRPALPADLTLAPTMRNIILDSIGAEVAKAIAARPKDRPVIASRYAVGNVLACERFYQVEEGIQFDYTPATAKGQVAGVLLRRWFFRDPRRDGPLGWDPIETTHDAMEELAEQQDKLGAFVGTLSQGARADLTAAVLDIVHAFHECWPADIPTTFIRANSALRSTLLNGRLVLTHLVSLKLGRPARVDGRVVRGTTLLDIRPGREFEDEERFVRWFAALLELLQTNVMPKRVVTWYAESQAMVAEEVDEEQLEAAAKRIAGAVRRMVRIQDGGEPSLNPGWRCAHCRVSDECGPGIAWLATTPGEV